MDFWEDKAVEKLAKLYGDRPGWKPDENHPEEYEEDPELLERIPDRMFYLDPEWWDWDENADIDPRLLEDSWNGKAPFDPFVEGPVRQYTVKAPIHEHQPQLHPKAPSKKMDRLAVDDPLRDPRVIPKLFPWEDYDDDDTEDENQPPSEEVIREMQKVNRILRREGEEGLERYLLETNARDAAAKSSEQAVYDPHELRPRHWMDSDQLLAISHFIDREEEKREEEDKVERQMSGEEPYDYSGPKEQLHLTPEQLLHKLYTMDRQLRHEEILLESEWLSEEDDESFARFQAENFAIAPACLRQLEAYRTCAFEDCDYEEEELNACAYEVRDIILDNCKSLLQEFQTCFEAPDEELLKPEEIESAPTVPQHMQTIPFPIRPANQGILFELHPEWRTKPYVYFFPHDIARERPDERDFRQAVARFANRCTNLQRQIYECIAAANPKVGERQQRGIDALKKMMANRHSLSVPLPLWIGGPSEEAQGDLRDEFSHMFARGISQRFGQRIYEPEIFQPLEDDYQEQYILDDEDDVLPVDEPDDPGRRWYDDFDHTWEQVLHDSTDPYYVNDPSDYIPAVPGSEEAHYQQELQLRENLRARRLWRPQSSKI